MLMIRNVHISLLAVPGRAGDTGSQMFAALILLISIILPLLFNPAGVAAQPRPKILAIILVVIGSSAG